MLRDIMFMADIFKIHSNMSKACRLRDFICVKFSQQSIYILLNRCPLNLKFRSRNKSENPTCAIYNHVVCGCRWKFIRLYLYM